ncbi:MAG: arginase family protein, partial [Yaniella sp.]|nr:arginase family protein [Yaniella sp.]
MLESPRVVDNGNIGPVNSAQVPRYSGESTFALLPRLRDLQTENRSADIKIIGAPFDSGVSYRPGARFGPAHVRQSSRLLRPYNPATDTSPFAQVQIADAGDMALPPFNIEEAIASVEEDALTLTEDGASILTIGGDHTIALPLLRAAAKRAGEPVALLHFDAHL